MQDSLRHGKVNPVAIALVPPIIFLAGLMIYSGFRAVAPSALTIASTQRVEAIEVIKGISPVTKRGLEIPQTASLRSGGSSRLVIAHSASNGAFLLVSGTISAGFIGEKVELDSMLHLKFARNTFRVESDGKPVDAFVFYCRLETKPLIVDDPNTNPEVSTMDLLFANQSIGPVPPGMLYADRYESDSGMKIEATMSFGPSGTMGLGEVAQLNFKLDPSSTAWIEMPRNVRLQHKAVGTENIDVGILIPLNDRGSGPFSISMFGEEVASVGRP
ncbi:MAG: hypothetical protein AAGD11_11260 [Planctomycetota bacterium]